MPATCRPWLSNASHILCWTRSATSSRACPRRPGSAWPAGSAAQRRAVLHRHRPGLSHHTGARHPHQRGRRHALENDDIATFSSHPNSPLTAAALALGEHRGLAGSEVVAAWAVGWEITAQTMKVCVGPRGNELINRGWFNQGFQATLGVAGLAARLLHLDVEQTRMALGHAASAMAGVMKNRGTDTKGFTAGSAAMHGVMAAELASLGFTADRDILDGEQGVARLLGLENGDPDKVLDGLGAWDLATRGSTIRLHASCGARALGSGRPAADRPAPSRSTPTRSSRSSCSCQRS